MYNSDVDTNIPSEKEFNSDGAAPQLQTLTKTQSKVIEVEGDDLEDVLHDDVVEQPPVFQTENNYKYYTVVAIVYMSRGLH